MLTTLGIIAGVVLGCAWAKYAMRIEYGPEQCEHGIEWDDCPDCRH